MHLPIRIVLLMTLALVFSAGPALSQPASASPAKSTPAPTPIPLVKVPLEAQSALAALQEVDANASRDQSSAEAVDGTLVELTNEIDARIARDRRLLTSSPTLEVLYLLKRAWHSLGVRLAAPARELTQDATSLEEQLGRLDKLNTTWQATLQAAKHPETPPAVLQRVQGVANAIERTRQATDSGRMQVLAVQDRLSEQEARVRTALSLIEQQEHRTLKSLFVRDNPPIWGLQTGLGAEWAQRSGESFSLQRKASAAFIKRLPFTFLIHALLIALMAAALHGMRRSIRTLAEQKPDLQRALPILDLPVSTAFALSMLLMPSLYAQAPLLVHAGMAAVMLIPTVVILRRLLERHSYPILNAMVILYFVGQLQVLASSLPVLARCIFLGQALGATAFAVWVLRGWRLPTQAAEAYGPIWRAIRRIAKIGLVILPAAFLANVFGYVNLGNLWEVVFFRTVYLAAMLYAAVRILEGLIIIALQVRPLGSLRVVSLHRPMLQRRTLRVLAFLAFLFWLNLLLSFFGLRDPLIATTQSALNANLAIGSLNVTLGHILAFVITVWASFLASKFLRFVLEEDVYHHLRLARGIPYAISTMLHYVILLVGFFIALGALGIDLTKVTILAGAFSVGIGFGLQNVINNFVSGLILLFERPIKVGDVIEVGGNVGEVSRIGIRASVIRTADGSEIIVPNGSLISGQVTNWTFSDRQRAVDLPVNVATGADPSRVAELLKTTAAAQPGVANAPLPQAHVVSFSAGAVTFQLRAWTDHHEDWAQLRSDLAVAVQGALARENIAVA
ncbi:MAG: mechanosensitive ion channel [Verrucomicrobia bacterium]|nr:mechanosensitive ion channel [Verrucomicrobiota bacterium]